MTEEEMMARGRELFVKCYGDVVGLPAPAPGSTFPGQTMKMFNDFWGDDRLTFREKRLVVMGIIAGLGADPSLFEIHAKSALRNGEMDGEELRAVVMMALPYVGFARCSPLFVASEKLLAAHNETAG